VPNLNDELKVRGREKPHPILRYYYRWCYLKALRKTRKLHSLNRSWGRDSKQGPREYEIRALTTAHRRSLDENSTEQEGVSLGNIEIICGFHH
jgi:hypothetical protein